MTMHGGCDWHRGLFPGGACGSSLSKIWGSSRVWGLTKFWGKNPDRYSLCHYQSGQPSWLLEGNRVATLASLLRSRGWSLQRFFFHLFLTSIHTLLILTGWMDVRSTLSGPPRSHFDLWRVRRGTQGKTGKRIGRYNWYFKASIDQLADPRSIDVIVERFWLITQFLPILLSYYIQ